MTSNHLKDRRVLVLGSAGSIGRLIRSELEKMEPAELLLYTRQHAQLPNEVSKLPREIDIVLNLAAVTRAEPANRDAALALGTNYTTIPRLIEHYSGTSCTLLMASTVRSTSTESMYSWSKIAAEAAVASTTDSNVSVVRFGNIIEAARSVQAIVASLHKATPGFITAGNEYYQSARNAIETLMFALDVRPGSIVTPLLSFIPVAFVAGYLAGTQSGLDALASWRPEYIDVATSPLIPAWWLPYTRIHKTPTLGSTGVKPYCLVTNFQGEQLEKEKTRDVKKIIEREERPQFGTFATLLASASNPSGASN